MSSLFRRYLVEVKKSEKFRFILSGLSVNCVGFVFYLILVRFWLGPKEALTFLYWLSVVVAFFINKKFVFKRDSAFLTAFLKYILVYFVGYFVSLFVMSVALDWLVLDYVTSMIIASVVMPVYFYYMQKSLVFR